jgi:mono/diheme cytochrome c family protein
MRLLIKVVLVNFVTLLLFNFPVQAFDIENGKALHNGNCVRCHDESKYMSENRKIKNYQQLHERVVQCEIMTELIWFDEEIDDVTAYLNHAFYKFNPEK